MISEEDNQFRASQSNNHLPNLIRKSTDNPTSTFQKSVKDRGYSNDGVSNVSSEYIDDLKRENVTLRIKLQELQALALQGALRGKGNDKSGGKGMETTVVRANTKIFKLEEILKQKDLKIQELLHEKKLTDNSRRELTKKVDNLSNEKNYFLKIIHDLQTEIASLKKSTVNGLVDELKSVKEQLILSEKKALQDKHLIHKQLQAIKLLDDKNLEMARGKHLTLNPLYDSTKRTDIYRQKKIEKEEAKNNLETIKMLNLAFVTDHVLEKLLEEQDKELEQEEARKKGAKPESQEQEEPKEWHYEYKKLRGWFIDTRFEYEHMDMKLKEEIQMLSRKLNDYEERYREKCKDYDMLFQVLSQSQPVKAIIKGSPRQKKKIVRENTSTLEPELANQRSFQEEVKEILQASPQQNQDEVREENRENDSPGLQMNREDITRRPEDNKPQTDDNDDGSGLVKLGQFNKDHLWDDIEELSYMKIKRIQSIAVWSDRKSLLGIQLNYVAHDGDIFEGPRHIDGVYKEKYAKEPWVLDEGDDLASVRGAVAVTHGIIWIEFVTKKGILMKYGNSGIGQESFRHDFKDNEVPVIVMGSYSVRERGEKAVKLNLSGLGFKVLKEGETMGENQEEKDNAAVEEGGDHHKDEQDEEKHSHRDEKDEKHSHRGEEDEKHSHRNEEDEKHSHREEDEDEKHSHRGEEEDEQVEQKEEKDVRKIPDKFKFSTQGGEEKEIEDPEVEESLHGESQQSLRRDQKNTESQRQV